MYKWITNYIAENEERWEEIELVRLQEEFEKREKTEWEELKRDEKIKIIQQKDVQQNIDKITNSEKWTVWRKDCINTDSRLETDVGFDNITTHQVDKSADKIKPRENNKLVNTAITLSLPKLQLQLNQLANSVEKEIVTTQSEHSKPANNVQSPAQGEQDKKIKLETKQTKMTDWTKRKETTTTKITNTNNKNNKKPTTNKNGASGKKFWKKYNNKPKNGVENNSVEKIVQLDPACTDTALEPSLEKINPHSTHSDSPPQLMEDINFERESLKLKVKITCSGLKTQDSDKD